MSDQPHIDQVARISDLLAEKLRARRGTFAQRVRKAGPKLPRQVRKAAERLVEAQMLAQHPKIARMLDETALRKSADLVIEHLEAIDPWDVFKGKLLKGLGWIAALLILGFVTAVWVARSRGLI